MVVLCCSGSVLWCDCVMCWYSSMWRVVVSCGCGMVQFGVMCCDIVRRCIAIVMVVQYVVVVTVVGVGCCGVV